MKAPIPQLHSIALIIDHPLYPQPITEDILFKTLDFFAGAIDNALPLSVACCTGAPGQALPVINRALSYMKKTHRGIHRHITWVLRTPLFPLSLEVLTYLERRGILFHWVPEPPAGMNFSQQVEEVYPRWLNQMPAREKAKITKTGKPGKWETRQKRIGLVTVPDDPGPMTAVPQALATLHKMGFTRINDEYWCSRCRAFPGKEEDAQLRSYMEIINANRYQAGARVSGGPYGFIDHFPIIRRLVTSRRNHYGCAAGIHYAAAAPDGTVYPCHAFVGRAQYIMGTISAGIDETAAALGIQQVDDRPPCSNCRGRYICGGGSNLMNVSGINGACAAYLTLVEQTAAEFKEYDLHIKNIILFLAKWLDNAAPHRNTHIVKPERLLKPRMLTVQGSSMQPLLRQGDKVTVAPVDPAKIRFGDIVCIGVPPVCHRVITKFKRNGEPFVLEKGDHVRLGTVAPLHHVTGKVISVHKTKTGKTISLATPRWFLFNMLMAAFALSVHGISMLLLSIKYKGRL